MLGGIGEYFNIDPLILRIIYLALAISSFLTMTTIYIISTAVIPLDNNIMEEDPTGNSSVNNSFLGISLIVLGIILLFNTFLPLYFPQLLSTIRYYSKKLVDFWPIILIILGISLLIDKDRK